MAQVLRILIHHFLPEANATDRSLGSAGGQIWLLVALYVNYIPFLPHSCFVSHSKDAFHLFDRNEEADDELS